MKCVGGSGSPLKNGDRFYIIEEVRILEFIPNNCISLNCIRKTFSV